MTSSEENNIVKLCPFASFIDLHSTSTADDRGSWTPGGYIVLLALRCRCQSYSKEKLLMVLSEIIEYVKLVVVM